jgi:hypothetical protein
MPEPITIVDEGKPSLSEDNQAALEELKQAEADLEKENAVAEEQQLIGGEFQSQEDLLAAYQELKQKQEQVDTPGEPQTAQEIYGETVGNRLEEAGVNYSKMNEYWQENGEITDKHYKELEKAGFPRSLVDTHLDGLRNQATVLESDLTAIKESYGGEDAFTAMQYWARDNLTEAEKAAYSKGINGDLETVKLTVAGLHARYSNAVGSEPNLISGKAATYSSDKFESTAQLEEAMNDPKYKKDPAFRAKVEEKLSRSSIF